MSTTTLNRNPESWASLTKKRWGMVIIDEAHQSPPGTELYSLYRTLSEHSDGILVLSATPSKRETQGLLGLLALVSPNRYKPSDEAVFQRLLEVRREVWDVLDAHRQYRESADFARFLKDREALCGVADEWEPILRSDDVATQLIRRLREGDGAAFDDLEAYVQEHYRVDHRIIRSRRRTVQSLGLEWCERRMEVVPYEPTPSEELLVRHIEEGLAKVGTLDTDRQALCAVYYRLLRLTPQRCLEQLTSRFRALRAREQVEPNLWNQMLSDPGPEEEARLEASVLRTAPSFEGEPAWLMHAIELAKAWHADGVVSSRHRAALKWIAAHLAAHKGHKLLVFSESREVVRWFAAELGRRLGKPVEAFHRVETVEEEESLKEITGRFQRRPDRPVLISDELGGEGRNFQMAEAVLHLDCPWAVSRLEQRIGRIDRIGRSAARPVRSVVFLGPGEVEREVHRVHAEVFRVHDRSIGGLEFLLPEVQREMMGAAALGAGTLAERIPDLAHRVGSVLAQAEKDFDMALDTSRREMEAARELVTDVLDHIDGDDRKDPVLKWARALGIKAQDGEGPDAEPEVRLKWDGETLRDPIVGLSTATTGKYRFTGTFNRARALSHENLQYFAPGHCLVDGLLKTLHTSSIGNLSVFGRDLGRPYARRLFVSVMVRFGLDPALWSDEPFPAGLLARAERRLPPMTLEQAVEVDIEHQTTVVVRERALRDGLAKEYGGRDCDVLLPPEAFASLDLGALVRVVGAGVREALTQSCGERSAMAEESLDQLRSDLGPELGFLRGRIERGEDESNELASELAVRELLLENVTNSRAELVGVALVIGR